MYLCNVEFANAAECLDKLNSVFESGVINIDYVSGQYKVSDKTGTVKESCTVSPAGFERYIARIRNKKGSDEHIVYGWNYLSINSNVIYDYAKSLRDYLHDDSFSDATKYKLYSIINNKFACYSYYYDNLYQGSSVHNIGEAYYCTDSFGKNLRLNKIFDEREIVTKLMKDPYIQKILSKSNSNKSSINNLKKLSAELNADVAANCLLCDDNVPLDSFVIYKHNSNGTVNIKYNVWQNSAKNCQNLKPDVITLYNLRPKFTVSNYVDGSSL